jgi:hypothetical protein
MYGIAHLAPANPNREQGRDQTGWDQRQRVVDLASRRHEQPAAAKVVDLDEHAMVERARREKGAQQLVEDRFLVLEREIAQQPGVDRVTEEGVGENLGGAVEIFCVSC